MECEGVSDSKRMINASRLEGIHMILCCRKRWVTLYGCALLDGDADLHGAIPDRINLIIWRQNDVRKGAVGTCLNSNTIDCLEILQFQLRIFIANREAVPR